MRESCTYGSGRGARGETRVPTATKTVLLHLLRSPFGTKRRTADSTNSVAIGGTTDMLRNRRARRSDAFDPYVWSGRAVQEVSSILAMRSCINVSGL